MYFQYTLKGETLASVSPTTYLGVCLSKNLEWKAHINKITKANHTSEKHEGMSP